MGFCKLCIGVLGIISGRMLPLGCVWILSFPETEADSEHVKVLGLLGSPHNKMGDHGLRHFVKALV